MKICDQRICNIEIIRRVNENICPAFGWLQQFFGGVGRFNGAHGGGAHRTNPVISLYGLVDDLAGHVFYTIIFGIHFMLAQVFDLYGSECAQPGMEGDFGKTDTFYLKSFDQFFTEMQASGWSGNGTFMFCIYGLISFLVFLVGFAFDVFWQAVFHPGFQAPV